MLRRVGYMRWAKSHAGRLEFDLTRSALPGPLPVELAGPGGAAEALVESSARGDPELVELVARRHQVGPEEVLITAGSTLGIFSVLAAELAPGDEVLLEHPAYSPIRDAVTALGGRVHRLPRPVDDGYQVDPGVLKRALRRRPRLVLLTNLHNPTGAGIEPERLTEIGRLCRQAGARLVVDEVYLDAWPAGVPAATAVPGALSVASLTKVYGLGAIRLGWVVGPTSVLARVDRAGDYLVVHPPRPSQRIGVAVLGRRDELLARGRRIAAAGRSVVENWLAGRDDVAWQPPAGGFVALIRVLSGVPVETLARELAERHQVAIVPGAFFGIRDGFRIWLGQTPEKLAEGLRRIGLVLDELAVLREPPDR